MSINAGGAYTFSKVAANNASADNTQRWDEGQPPSSLNDSARALLASIAKWRDDLSGSIVTSGTNIAYQIASNQQFIDTDLFDGNLVAFTPHLTNSAGPVTVSIDGIANVAVRSATNTEIQAGVLIQGTPYVGRFSKPDHALYLQNFYGNPYNVPLGASLEYWLPIAPNSSFAFPFGQAISRTTYATLFTAMGTTYGAGDGSTTFNIPDVRGRVTPSMDNMGGTAAGRLTNSGTGNSGINGASLGATGGAQSEVLVTANLPPYTPAGSIANGAISATTAAPPLAGNNNNNGGGGGAFSATGSGNASVSVSQNASSFAGTAQGGTNAPVITMPPSIVCNRILRIL